MMGAVIGYNQSEKSFQGEKDPKAEECSNCCTTVH